MSMLANNNSFRSALRVLWDNPKESTTYKDTCDLLESHWQTARVTGHELPQGPTFVPRITYGPMAPLGVSSTGTSAGAAAAIEAALSAMCIASVFVLIAPSVASGVPLPLPGGKATPGLLTATLTGLFEAGAVSGASTSSAIAAELVAYLAGWILNVTTGPTTAPFPII